MIKEEDRTKINSVKRKVEKDSATLQRIVDQLVAQHNKDLDRFMDQVKDIIDNRDDIDDLTLEKMAIRVPVYMYYSNRGLEALGIQYDYAKANRLAEYNTYFMDAEGTIKDKEAEAGLKVIPEQMMEVALQRAYKTLKQKLETCEILASSLRKVIGMRTQDMFNASQEGNRVER